MRNYYGEMTDSVKFFQSRLGTDETVALDIPSDELSALNDVSAIYVYCSKDLKTYYIGQANSFFRRHAEHTKEISGDDKKYKKYFGGGSVLIFYGEMISSNLNYIEQRLVKIFGELRVVYNFSVLNVSGGNKSDFRQIRREHVDKVILKMLEKMKDLGFVRFSNGQVTQSAFNSFLYRYSPFFELEDKQKEILDLVMLPHYSEEIRSKRDRLLKHNRTRDELQTFIVRGGAGTGKTVLMNHIIAQLLGANIGWRKDKHDRPIRVGVCLKRNMISAIKGIFKVYEKNLNEHGIYIGTWMDILKEGEKNRFDYIIVDEAQRLLKYRNFIFPEVHKQFLKDRHKENALNLILNHSDKVILFYDETQTIRPTDIDPIGDKGNYNDIYRFPSSSSIVDERLSVQFRIKINADFKGYRKDYSVNYIKYIKYMLGISDEKPSNLDFLDTDYFGIVESLKDLKGYIDWKRDLFPFKRSRIISGYSKPIDYRWEELGGMIWNEKYQKWSTDEDTDCINRSGKLKDGKLDGNMSKNQVGAIHSIQGYEMDYIGLIVGEDIQYDTGNKQLIANKKKYYDKRGKSGLTDDELLAYIKNIYYVLLTRGIYGIRVYFENQAFKQYWEEKTEELKKSL